MPSTSLTRHATWLFLALVGIAGWAQAQTPTVPPTSADSSGGTWSRVDQSSAGRRTFTLRERVPIAGAQGCANAKVIQLTNSHAARPGEPALIETAVRTGKTLRLSDAQCGSDGVVSASGVSMDPVPNVVDPCTIAAPPHGHPDCRK